MSRDGSVRPSVVRNEREQFADSLVDLVESLYEQDLYSDLRIVCADRTFPAHRFVLAVQTSFWGDLRDTDEIRLESEFKRCCL